MLHSSYSCFETSLPLGKKSRFQMYFKHIWRKKNLEKGRWVENQPMLQHSSLPPLTLVVVVVVVVDNTQQGDLSHIIPAPLIFST